MTEDINKPERKKRFVAPVTADVSDEEKAAIQGIQMQREVSGATIKIGKKGSFIDPKTNKEIAYDDSIAIIKGTKLKLSARCLLDIGDLIQNDEKFRAALEERAKIENL